MFNKFLNETDTKNFYPTPFYVVDKMVDKVSKWNSISTILEPSAGKGDIVEGIEQKESRPYYDRRSYDIDCIEIDDNLRHILTGKGFKVVHNDFLNYGGYKKYDLIIMNPPFDKGEKHLLKALDMQARGGQIVCLLNADSLLNPNTIERKVLIKRLNQLEADIDFLDEVFESAERKTRVKIALVYVNIVDNRVFKDESFIYNELKKAKEEEDVYYEPTDITDKTDFYEQIVEQFNFEVKGGIKLIREYKAFAPYIPCSFKQVDNPAIKRYAEEPMLTISPCDINEYLKSVRYKYWTALFSNESFTENLTSNLIQEYRENINKLENYDFSMFNIKAIQLEMAKNMVKGVEETILDLFEEFSNKHHWYDEMSNNIHYYNGWKTNKSYIVNKKVIIPLSGYDNFWGKYAITDYRVVEKLIDIEKVFNYLDNGLTEEMNLREALEQAKEEVKTKKIQLKYFKVTFYKKGTCHIEFSNLDLLKKFNIYGSQHKGWLPPVYGKSTYGDMTEEEKAVIDEFEGEKEYNKTMLNKSYYLEENVGLTALPTAI